MNIIEPLFNRKYISSDLRVKYTELRKISSLRRRDIAAELQVSEAELIDQQCDVKSIRLSNDFGVMIEKLPVLGYIMTLTRNEYAVHERKGVYDNVSVNDAMALVIGSDRKIDLRIMLHRWEYGFAVMEQTDNGCRYSLQFFDQEGTAIQKIFLQPESDAKAYAGFVSTFRIKDQYSPLEMKKVIDFTEYAEDDEVDITRLTQEWSKMTDVHQFFRILRNHKVSREQAFRLVNNDFARNFEPETLESVLTRAAQQTIPIMCFVGNHGNIQIHSGVVKNIKRMGSWINVLDHEFNLHIQEEGIVSAWLVRKPTKDGPVTSLEFYDRQGDLVVQFFGLREEGQPENTAWRHLAEGVLINRLSVA